MIKNYMEDVVNNILPVVLTEYKDICKCPRCLDDIRALGLNSLKPMYVVTEQGNIYVKLNELKHQFRADIMRELIRAIEIVSNNPRHNL